MKKAGVRVTPRWVGSLSAVILTSALFWAGIIHAGGLGAQTPGDTRAQVGFGAAVDDQELWALLNRHEVSPVAVHMQIAGLTGTHRAYVGRSALELMRNARAKSTESFANGLESNLVRLQRFIQAHTEDEVAANADLQEEARGLLNVRSQLEAARTAVESGVPLIVAMEVVGISTAVEKLRTDAKVRTFTLLEAASSGRERAAQSIPPAPQIPEYVDQRLLALDAHALYRSIQALVAGQ